MSKPIPQTQYALQLVGPGELRLNREKPVFTPGAHQLLCRVEASGLCFSDLKLLKQFTEHARKSEVLAGMELSALKEIPSYVPGELPTVPGHEAVVRVVQTGEEVTEFEVGKRYLVQADFRWLRTRANNGAFGYNFEGGLQEYVLLDTRVILSPEGESMLIPVGEDLSASAIALVEPWACVEDAYVSDERAHIKPGGSLLVVAEDGAGIRGLAECFDPAGPPAKVTLIGEGEIGVPATRVESVEALGEAVFDDIVYFGARKATIEALDARLAAKGILNVVLGGKEIGEKVLVSVGRVHYGGIRLIGTVSESACESLKSIPATGEIRPNEVISVVGAGGPMGVMHVVRTLCQGVPGTTVIASDFDDARLGELSERAEKLAAQNGVTYIAYNPSKQKRSDAPTYVALMAPVPALVGQAVDQCGEGGIINIFAGIAASITHELDLDRYFAKKLFMIGTSGSSITDMKLVLEKVESGRLDTNFSVAAVSGMAGAADGIAAVENRTMAGKILVYPMLRELDLIPLAELETRFPTVFEKLEDGGWCKAAEEELLRVAAE